MRDKSLALLFLMALTVLPMRFFAQDGLTLAWPDESCARISLRSYTGLDLVAVDTLTKDANGLFTYGPTLPLGMYVIGCDQAEVEFLSMGKPLTLFVDDPEDAFAVRFASSPENTRWMAYQRIREAFFRGDMDELSARHQIDSLVADTLDYAARLMLADSHPEWQATDFQDPDLIPTNVLTTKMVRFLERSGDDFIKGVDEVLQRAKVNMTSYEFALRYLLKGFTAMGLSEVTDHLLNFPQLSEGEITEAEGNRLVALTEPYQKVRVGAKAPDYRGVTIDGEPYDLYESQARRILLVFWSVDCEYCHDFLVQIRKHLNLRKDYELVTFALADDRDEVCREVRRMRLRGRHFYDEARWEGKAFLDYHVVSTPMVLLLNEDKTIVCKPYQWEDLEHYLELNP